jgi:hypothetical protein
MQIQKIIIINIESKEMAKIEEDIMKDDDTFLLEESTVEKKDLSFDNDNIDQQQNDVVIQATTSNSMADILKNNPLLMNFLWFILGGTKLTHGSWRVATYDILSYSLHRLAAS